MDGQRLSRLLAAGAFVVTLASAPDTGNPNGAVVTKKLPQGDVYDVEVLGNVPKKDVLIFCWNKQGDGPTRFDIPAPKGKIEEDCMRVASMVKLHTGAGAGGVTWLGKPQSITKNKKNL